METSITRPVTSASNLYRRALCPGSERLEAGLPDDEDSEEAKIGTLLHQYDANPKLDRSFLSQRTRELLKISAACDERVFDRLAVLVAESQVIEKWTFMYPFQDSTKGETWMVGDIPGHTDRWRYYPPIRLLVVIDKKFGFKEVTPATANYQLRHYAAAGAGKLEANTVVVAITQPRLPYEQRITMARYEIDDIAAARDEILSIVAASREPDAPLIPGPEQCRYCKARLVCPALRAEMEKSAALVPVSDGTLTKRKADVEEIIARCSDEDLDRIIQFVRMAKFVEDKAIEEGRIRVAAGNLPMYELGKASEPRYIADPLKAYALLNLRHLLDSKEVWQSCSMALGKIEEGVAARNKITMKEARKLIESVLGDTIQREERKPPLIRKA
jgi:hypothetical protein